MKAPLPPNETARLQALHRYAILDTLEEQAFNDVTMLASFICETPIALISLVDSERQWFKSRLGLQAAQTPREHAFCAHAILQPNEVLVVSDAQSDPRFVDNPLVTGEPRIRFYAGAPLMTPAGHPLGTVCVIDRTPRELSEEKVEALRALSRQVVAQLELRRIVAEIQLSTIELKAYQRQLEAYKKQVESANAELQAQSITDALTGIGNRRAFDRTLGKELERASRSNTRVSLLLADIDAFKPYNDRYGHPAGDEALRQVARVLSRHARGYDVVARYGGEEFAVILPNTGIETAIQVGERLRSAVEAASWPNRAVTISIGASTSAGSSDATTVISQADQALYRAKGLGRNRVCHASRGP
ncbi:MAG: sensor domain-containing diguanylate cyclase [Thiobacillaceae bacterium]